MGQERGLAVACGPWEGLGNTGTPRFLHDSATSKVVAARAAPCPQECDTESSQSSRLESGMLLAPRSLLGLAAHAKKKSLAFWFGLPEPEQ